MCSHEDKRQCNFETNSLYLHWEPLEGQDIAGEDNRLEGGVHGVNVATREEKSFAFIDHNLQFIELLNCI